MTNIFSIDPLINLKSNEAVNLLLASIAFEELSLSHIINSEAEKIQFVNGTLNLKPTEAFSTSEILKINQSINKTLRNVAKNQMLLQFKLEDSIQYKQVVVHSNTAQVTALFNNRIYSDSDSAYYHTLRGLTK